MEDAATIKRAAMAICALALSIAIVSALDIRLLALVGVGGNVRGDRAVSALVLSAGSEGANSVIKVLEAFEQSRQAVADGVAVVIATPRSPRRSTRRSASRHDHQQRQSGHRVGVRRGLVEGSSRTRCHGRRERHDEVPGTPGVFPIIAASAANPAKTAVMKLAVTP